MNVIYIVFCVMENEKTKKNKFFPALPSATLGKFAMALSKAGNLTTQLGLFAECRDTWHSAKAAYLPSVSNQHSAKRNFKKKILCRVSATSALGKEAIR